MSSRTQCTVVGSPGAYAEYLMRAARRKQWAAWFAASVMIAVAVATRDIPALAGVSVLLAATAFLVGLGHRASAAKAAVGWRAERDTVDALTKANFPGTVFCGLLLGRSGGDADLVVVRYDNAVFVSEVKAVHGKASVRGGQLFSNNRPLPRQPVPQVRREVDALGRLGVPSQPFVVASRADNVAVAADPSPSV